MAKIDLETLASGYLSTSNLNNNFQSIEDELNDKVLYRDPPGGEANDMKANIDMGSKKIINSADGVNPADLVTKRQLEAYAAAALGTIDSSVVTYSPTGTGAVDTTVQAKLRESVSVKDFGAVGDGVTNDTAAIQAAFTAITEFSTLYIPAGNYLVTSELDLTGKKNFSIKGEFRASIFLVNHSDEAALGLENISYTLGGTPQRGIIIENISIYPASAASSLPVNGLQIVNCPEIRVTNCTFINCATAYQMSIGECWDAVVEFNFISARENLLATHGAANNTSSGGIGLYVPSECHAMSIAYNRIRTGSPGISYGGGDATEIRLNAIESNLTTGINMAGSCQAVTIDRNYFEGSQTWDVNYLAAGTNFAHSIKGNYFHAVNGVKFDANCSTQGLSIKDNQFFSGNTGIELEAINTSQGVRIVDNTFRDMAAAYEIPSSSMLTAGLSYPENQMVMRGNVYIGTTPDTPGLPNDLVMKTKFPWDTFSGTGSVSDSAVYHNGILLYDLAGTSSWTAFADAGFDPSLKGEFVTINMAFITPAGTNVTVTIDDGVATKTYSCNSAATGSAAVDNQFYYLMSATADKLRVRVTVGSITIQSLMPGFRRGCHDTPSYIDNR